MTAGLASTLTGCATAPEPRIMPPPTELAQPPLGREPFNLLKVAAEHVRVAEASRTEPEGWSRLWGRVGGSRAEGASANLLEEQLRPWVHSVGLEGFAFEAERPDQWRVTISGQAVLASAMPAPLSARFPDGIRSAPLHLIQEEADWKTVRGQWAFVPARPGDSLRRNPARDNETYARAVKAGAAGLIFSLPTPAGTWRSVVEARPDAPTNEELFGTPFHPIPCFCVDAEDGARLAEAAPGAAELSSQIVYEPLKRRNGENLVALLRGSGADPLNGSVRMSSLGSSMFAPGRGGSGSIAFFANLDGYFSGATENASGLATLVGLAQQLAMGPRLARRSDIYFIGLSGQHDSGAGLRAFAEADLSRFARIRQFYYLRRTDAALGEGVGQLSAQATPPIAFLGETSWNDVARAIPDIFRESGMEGEPPQVTQSSALMDRVIDTRRRGARTFCLDRTPPYSFTNHDTLDKLTGAGLERSVDFHLRLIETAGALVPGTFRETLRTQNRTTNA